MPAVGPGVDVMWVRISGCLSVCQEELTIGGREGEKNNNEEEEYELE